MRKLEKFIHQGIIINTHGLKGEVKLEVWCDDPYEFMKIKTLYLDPEGKQELKVISYRIGSRHILAKLDGVTTREQAEKYKNSEIYVSRESLKIPKNKCLTCDIIGLPVKDANTGKLYGTVADVMFNPANDIYVVETKKGETLIPAVPEFIKKVDVYDAVYVTLIPGMMDEIDEDDNDIIISPYKYDDDDDDDNDDDDDDDDDFDYDYDDDDEDEDEDE